MKLSIDLVLRCIAALILLQTLYFKFTAHPESVMLFTKLGVEPWGRVGTGIIELIVAFLLLYTPTVLFGAFFAIGLMLGAILSHLFVIGLSTNGDGGQLFMLAIVVLLISTYLLYKRRGIIFQMISPYLKQSKTFNHTLKH